MAIFEESKNAHNRVAGQAEPLYEYFRDSKRQLQVIIRNTIEGWFKVYQSTADSDKIKDLERRLQSKDDNGQFLPAFTELYVFILLKNNGYEVIPEKEVGNGKKPDFLVKKPNGEEFYVEVTTVSEGKFNTTRNRAINLIIDKINKRIKSNYYVHLIWEGNPLENDITPKVLKDIQTWVDRPKGISSSREFPASPSTPQWSLRLEILRAKRERGGKFIAWISNSKVQNYSAKKFRPNEIIEGGSDILTAIKEKLGDKATHYGELGKPYVIVVNILSDNVDKSIVQDAILSVTLERKTPFFSKYKNVNGVLFFSNLKPQNMMMNERNHIYFDNLIAQESFNHDVFKKLYKPYKAQKKAGVLNSPENLEPGYILDHKKLSTHMKVPQQAWDKALELDNPDN